MTTIQEQIKALWQLEDYCSDKAVCAAGQRLYVWLRNNNRDVLAQYISGQKPPPVEIPPFSQLERDIVRHFLPLSQAILHLMALAQVVNQGNVLGIMDICPPRIPFYLPPDKSPFQDEYLNDYRKAQRWRECVISPELLPPHDSREFIGRLLASAALNGGLLHGHGLTALYLKLSEPIEAITSPRGTPFSSQNTLLFYDLKISSGTTNLTRLQRWFPDILTEFLILSLTGKIPKTTNDSSANQRIRHKVFSCIKKFFAASGIEVELIPTSLTSFLNVAQAEMWLHLPGCLVDFAAGKLAPHSPKDYVWKRMFHLLKPQIKQADDGNNAEQEPIPANVGEGKAAAEAANIFPIPWLKEIITALKHPARGAVKRELRVLLKKFGNSEYSLKQLIRGWAEFMITNKSFAGNKLYLSTIRNYIGQISNRLVGYANDKDITLLEGEGLEEIYRQILSDITSESYRQSIARGLREFHFYLIEEFHLAPINYKEVLGLVSPDRIVDANIISFDEYHAILEDLDRRHSELALIHADLPDIVRLIFILAFRCGLRRSEVLKLMIDDLHEMPPAVLLIRPNFARTLKTKSSVRQIPLSALLEPDELDDLIQFLNRRLYQEHKSGYSDFLFAMPDNLNPIAPEVRVFSIITETMRRVTGDPSPKFHHLRHSFASWSLFRLMLAASKAGRDVQLPNMPITTTYLNNSVRFSKRLLGAHFPTRKYVRAVAGLLGHSGPESSIPHYIHFSDLLLKLMLAKSLPCNGHTALTTLLNVHRTTSYRWYKRDGLDGLMKNFRKKMAGKRLVVNQKITANMKDIDSNVDMPVPSEVKFIYKVWTYLRLSSRSGAKSDEIQTRLAISNNQCRQFEDCIGAMKKRQAPNRQGTPFLWIYEILDLRVPDRKIESKGIQGPCTREYEDIVKRFIPLVWNLFRTDYDLTCTVLKLFLNNTWGSESGIIFRGFKEAGLARRYIKFLKLLGLRKDQIKLYSYDYNSKRSRCCGKWFRLLNLNKSDRIVKRLPPFASESKAVNEWLRVDVKLLPGAKTGSSAFRFLMTMSLICLDFPGKYD